MSYPPQTVLIERGLPEIAAKFVDYPRGVVLIGRGENGFHPFIEDKKGILSDDFLRAKQDEYNRALAVTPQQREAMFIGSMSGWSIPAADPRAFNERGELQPLSNHE